MASAGTASPWARGQIRSDSVRRQSQYNPELAVQFLCQGSVAGFAQADSFVWRPLGPLPHGHAGKSDRIPFDDNRNTTRNWQYSFFVKDQWQASRKLTLSYGVRWDRFPMGTRANQIGFRSTTIAIQPGTGSTVSLSRISGRLRAS